MAPQDQREHWHQSLTERNEARLPEKLREELKLGKRRAEQGLKKQSSDVMSYFLVEFMGTHEFIWVRESDIIETFDPEVDPNVAAAAGNITKKRRSTASSFNAKAMSDAIEEGRWALEEFEIQLSDTCGDQNEGASEFGVGYTYDVICQTDEEAEEMDSILEHGKDDESDTEEKNELLANSGRLDFSVEGRKKAKARATELKKHKAMRVKQEKDKSKDSHSKASGRTGGKSPRIIISEADTKQLARHLEADERREKKELDVRRKKRVREHDRLLREIGRDAKKNKLNTPEKKTNSNEIKDKKSRAEAVIKSFLIQKCQNDSNFNGASFIPTNSVDPSGLLGMALSFRAAAGEIPFEESGGNSFVTYPWDKIDANAPAESSERCRLLQEQIALVEKEIVKVDAAKQRRLDLHNEAKKTLIAVQQNIVRAGEEVTTANASALKGKKRSVKKKDSKLDAAKSDDGADDLSGITPNTSTVSTPEAKQPIKPNGEAKHDVSMTAVDVIEQPKESTQAAAAPSEVEEKPSDFKVISSTAETEQTNGSSSSAVAGETAHVREAEK
jgi:hypothetical protein